jgi:hypothetical protein
VIDLVDAAPLLHAAMARAPAACGFTRLDPVGRALDVTGSRALL